MKINDKIIELENSLILEYKRMGADVSMLSDGYHSFGELYDFRMIYNACLFNEWAKGFYDQNGVIDTRLPKHNVHKSKRHFDGELCFSGGWFIVVAILPTGQISNHYEEKYWDLFNIPETE